MSRREQNSSTNSWQTELHFEQELHFILLMGRTHCAHRYFLSHWQRLMHRFVTRPFAPLSLGTRWDRISRMTVLLAFFRVLAIALNPRFERRPFSISERSAKVRCGMVLSSCLMVACPASLRD